jgi:hypothetical protein
VVKLVHLETGHEIDTKGMDPGDYNARVAAGYVTPEQLKAEKKADADRLAALKEAATVDPAKPSPAEAKA